MPNIGDITGRIVIQDTGSPAAIKFGENLDKISKTITSSMSRATLATETAVREIAAKLNTLKSQTKATETGKGLLSDLQALIKKRQEEIATLKAGPAAIEALNKKRFEEAQALKIAAAQVDAGISAESDLGKEIAKNIRTLDKYEHELSQVAKAQAIAAQRAEQQVAAYRKMSDVGSMLTARVTLPLVGLAAISFKTSTDLNRSLANVSALLTDLTGDDLNQAINSVKANIQSLAPELGKSTGDLAEGFYEVVSSLGYTNDSLGQLEIAARAGAAGLATTQESINFLTAVTKTYGDTSEKAFKQVADLGFQSVNIGQTTFPQLAASIGSVAPVAQAAGVSLEEMFAIIATATGVTGNTSEVTNQMAAAITALLSPTEQLKGMYKQLGVSSGEAMIAEHGLVGSLQLVAQYAQAAGIPIINLVGRKEAFIITASLAGAQAKTFATNLDKMGAAAKANGAIVTDAFEKQTQGINKAGFQYEQAKVKLEVLSQRLGDQLAPSIVKVIEKVTEMVEVFSDLPVPIKGTLIVVGSLAAAIGPLLFVTGQLLLSWRQIVVMAPRIVVSFTSITAAIGLTSTALQGLVVVGVLLFINKIIEKWGEAQTAVTNYNLEVARIEGGALEFAQQVSQGPLSSTVSRGTFDQKIKEADILAGHIKRITAEVETLNKTIEAGEGQQGFLGGLANQARRDLKPKEQELKNLWSAYGKLRTALADVTIAGEKAGETLGTGKNPFAGLVTSSKEALGALKSVEDMILALERQRKDEESLFTALGKGPEAYRAQQRANEIDLKIQEARNTLTEQGLSLSAEMEARIRSAVGAIFDLGTATEKLNAIISVSNSLYQTSITNIGNLADAVKSIKLEATEQNITSLSKAFLDSDLNIAKMEAALSLLNPESDLAKKLTHQLVIETDALTKAYESNSEAIRQRSLAIAEASRHSEDTIRRELAAIRERNDAMMKGPGSIAALERQRDIASEVSRIMADLKPNLGTETIEEFGARWLRLAKEIRTELETEYKIEIAADLKASLETPSEALQKYLDLINDLSHAVDTSGKAILTAAEAEKLRTRAIHDHISEQISDWGQFFAYLENAFGGVFKYISQAINQLEQARSFGDTVTKLAENSSSKTLQNYAGALGGVATVFAIFAAIYQGVSDHIKKKKLQRYGADTEFEMIKGDIGTTALAAQSNDVVRAIKATIKAFGDALGGVVTDIAEIGIRIRNDGKHIAAYVKGEMIGHFATVDEAIHAALREMVINGGIQLGGISDLVKLGFDQSYRFPDFDDLITFLKNLKEVSDFSFSPAIIDQLSQVRHFDDLWKALEKVSHVTDAVVKGFQNLGIAEAQTWQALFDSITGRQRSQAEIRADKERELTIAKAELEIRKAAIGQRILQAKAEIEALKAGNMFIGGGGKAGRGGGILGVATAFAVAGEALIGVSSAVTRTISAESEAMIALLEKEIEGLEELLKALGDIKIPDINFGGGGKGSGLKDLRDDIRKQIAQLVAESKGPLHAAFYNFEQSLREFRDRAKEAKLPTDELAKGIELLIAAFRKGLMDSARDRAGMDTDFAKRLRDTQQFFNELEALGRKNTGIPDWLRKWLEGQAFEKLGSELIAMIGEFNGLSDPMMAINARAAELRQNILAFAEAAGWSSDQIKAAMDAIEAGAQYQRQQGINSVLDRLFGYLKQAGLYQKDAMEFERGKAIADIALMEAELRFYGALTAQTQAWIDAAREFILGPGFGAGNNNNDIQKVRVVNSTNDWDEIVDKIKSLVDDWRQAVKQFADSTAALMTDDELSNLTQEQQLAFAKTQVEDLAAKAQGGDLEALQKLEQARAEYLKELRQSEGAGFGFGTGWDWVMGLTAGVLENAQDAEQNLIAQELAKNIEAWSYVMAQLADQLEAAFYLNTQDLIDAIYNAIGGVPGFASGGVVMRGPRIVRVAEYIPEAIVPLDRLANMVPYPKIGDRMNMPRGSQSDYRSGLRQSISDRSDRDTLTRLSSVEITSAQTARALASIRSDISAMRRRDR